MSGDGRAPDADAAGDSRAPQALQNFAPEGFSCRQDSQITAPAPMVPERRCAERRHPIAASDLVNPAIRSASPRGARAPASPAQSVFWGVARRGRLAPFDSRAPGSPAQSVFWGVARRGRLAPFDYFA